MRAVTPRFEIGYRGSEQVRGWVKLYRLTIIGDDPMNRWLVDHVSPLVSVCLYGKSDVAIASGN